MSKMEYFSNKFSKIDNGWSLSVSSDLKFSNHRYYVTKLTSQDFSILGFSVWKFLATPIC